MEIGIIILERRNIHTGTTHATSKFTCETVNFYNQALKVDFLTRKLLKKMQMIHDTKSRTAHRTLRIYFHLEIQVIIRPTDYWHTMAKSLILCGPNSNPK